MRIIQNMTIERYLPVLKKMIGELIEDEVEVVDITGKYVENPQPNVDRDLDYKHHMAHDQDIKLNQIFYHADQDGDASTVDGCLVYNTKVLFPDLVDSDVYVSNIVITGMALTDDDKENKYLVVNPQLIHMPFEYTRSFFDKVNLGDLPLISFPEDVIVSKAMEKSPLYMHLVADNEVSTDYENKEALVDKLNLYKSALSVKMQDIYARGGFSVGDPGALVTIGFKLSTDDDGNSDIYQTVQFIADMFYSAAKIEITEIERLSADPDIEVNYVTVTHRKRTI